MTPERWREVRDAFDRVVDLGREEQDRALEELAGRDADLAREVRALVAAGARDARFLADPANAPASGDAADRRGERVGAWELLSPLGEGGMGRVYLARRADSSFEKLAAVKFVHAELLSPWLRERFAAERQALATLEHPGIARLLDGGESASGEPYLVLEYVEGRPLVADALARQLGLRARIELFLQVLEAVAYAHRHLVVHRDLKPGNILVTAEGEAKLLDFGIAKILDPSGSSGTATRTFLRALTPEYASPEQVRGEPISTASDVYSLGVVLYELLTGERPYRLTSRTPEEASRAVLEQEPRRPSTVGGPGVDRPPLERCRLRGDLDTIVLKALAKDPARRYASVADFAGDLRRHLAGLPVLARPDRFAYRARKFVVRHRWAVAAAGLAAFSLLLGSGVALRQAAAARRAEAGARSEAETARRVSEFLVDLFKISEPGEARGNAVTARELLDRGARQVEEQLGAQPAVRARLLRAIGRAYGELGLYEPASLALESELAAEVALYGPESAETAATLSVLAKAQMNRAAYAEARDSAGRALAIQERLHGPEDLATADTLSQLGIAHWYLGNLEDARRVLERSLSLRERLLGPQHGDLGGILNNVAILRAQQGDLAGARDLYERALALFERDLGPDHPNVARTLNNLAIVRLDAGDAAAARGMHERALAVRRRILAADHPEIAESLNNLGEALRGVGEREAARAALADALAIRERALGTEHPLVGVTLLNLGLAQFDLGDAGAARTLLERSFRVLSGALGEDHYQVGYPLAALADVDRSAGDLVSSERRFRRAFELFAAGPGVEHPSVAPWRGPYAEVLRRLGREAEAERLGPVATAAKSG